MKTFHPNKAFLVVLSLGLALSSRAVAQAPDLDPYGLDNQMRQAQQSIEDLKSLRSTQSAQQAEVRPAPVARLLTNEEMLQNLLQQKRDADSQFSYYETLAYQLQGDEDVLRNLRYYQSLSDQLGKRIRELERAMNPPTQSASNGASSSYSVRSSDQTVTTSVQPSTRVKAPQLSKPNFDGGR